MRAVGLAPRAAPLAPEAVLSLGDGARAVARRLLSRSDEQLARLRAVVGPGLLLVMGAEEELPWADGAVYLAREPDAPELWLPCAVCADVPAPLLLRALTARFKSNGVEPPYAVLLAPTRVVSLQREQALRRETLVTFTAREQP